MKKTIYTIGRDLSSDICLDDGGNLISRYHAVLKVKKNGTYVIIDQSLNGTYINGVRIAQGKEVPLTRKDTVMFANVLELDWSLVPVSDKWRKPVLISVSVAMLLAVAVCAIVFIPSCISGVSGDDRIPSGSSAIFPQDRDSRRIDNQDDGDRLSLRKLRERKRAEEKRQRELEEARLDSIRNAETVAPVQTETAVPEEIQSEIAENDSTVSVAVPDADTGAMQEPEPEPQDTVSNLNVNAIY